MEKKVKTTILKPVFIPSVVLLSLLVFYAAGMPEHAANVFSSIKDGIAEKFGWFYMLSVAVIVAFALFLVLSSYGRFRLGPDQSTPAYSNTSWFAMLFSAGMGIGLMFFGVAEPVTHFLSPPVGEGGGVENMQNAMNIVFLHWGLHAWGIYAIVGLVLAYFSFRHGLPLSIRSALYPLIGDRIYGGIGHTVDTVAVLGTILGVATSLGFGVLQINSGLNYLFDVPIGIGVQVVLIAITTALATISVVMGLDGGIKRLSELNIYLAVALMAFIFLLGPTFHILSSLVQNIGSYLSEIVFMTFNLYAYDKTTWMGGWTLFYWAWWISWAPFVGMFIARVSRGRTIREFIVGVMFVPVGFTFIWMSVFGNTALDAITNKGFTALSDAVSADVSTALFKFLEHFPFSGITSAIAVILVITFFVTSADSGSLVVDTIASGGKEKNPVWQRIFWAILEGVVAAALLVAGGLGALQAASITIALPFAAIMLVACWGLWRALNLESIRYESLQHHMNAGRHSKMSDTWQSRLSRLTKFPPIDEVKRFIREDVIHAMELVESELKNHHWQVNLSYDPSRNLASFCVAHEGDMNFIYEVRVKDEEMPTYASPEFTDPDKIQKKYARAEVSLQDGNKAYDIYGYDEDVIATDIIDQFEKHRHFLHNTSSLELAVPVD